MKYLVVLLLFVSSAFGTEVSKDFQQKILVVQDPNSSFQCSKERAVGVLWAISNAFNLSAKEIPNMVILCLDKRDWKPVFEGQKDFPVVITDTVTLKTKTDYLSYEIWIGEAPKAEDYARAFVTVLKDCLHWQDDKLINQRWLSARSIYNSTSDVSDMQKKKSPCAR